MKTAPSNPSHTASRSGKLCPQGTDRKNPHPPKIYLYFSTFSLHVFAKPFSPQLRFSPPHLTLCAHGTILGSPHGGLHVWIPAHAHSA